MFSSTLVTVTNKKSLSHDLYGPTTEDKRDLAMVLWLSASKFNWGLPNVWDYIYNPNLNIILKKGGSKAKPIEIDVCPNLVELAIGIKLRCGTIKIFIWGSKIVS